MTARGTLDISRLEVKGDNAPLIQFEGRTTNIKLVKDHAFDVRDLLPGTHEVSIILKSLVLEHETPVLIGSDGIAGLVIRFDESYRDTIERQAKAKAFATVDAFLKEYGLRGAK